MGIARNPKHLTLLTFFAMLCVSTGASLCFATHPILDTVKYEGKIYAVWDTEKAHIPLPENAQIAEIRRATKCTAGGPRGIWKIHGNQLWLERLARCDGRYPLNSTAEFSLPIKAEWVNASLISQTGNRLCGTLSAWGPDHTIYQTDVQFKIDRGVVVSILHIDNSRHPAIPTPDYLRALVKEHGGTDDEAERLIAELPYLRCISR